MFPIYIVICTGYFVRYILFQDFIIHWVQNQNEIVTPLTSWYKATEGIALLRHGISPYSGDILHQMPLSLQFIRFLINICGQNLHQFFIIVDIIISLVLDRIALRFSRYILKDQSESVKQYSPKSVSLLIRSSDLYFLRLTLVTIYLLNPFTVMTCLAKSTAIFNNLAITLTFYHTLKGNRTWACISIALASYLSLYPILLVIPLAFQLCKLDRWSGKKESFTSSLFSVIVITFGTLLCLIYISFIKENSWKFLHSTYGFILSVPDLSPNVGVFWYFFTEMFEHFRLFFICVFQINACIYTVPLAIKLKNHPMFLMLMIISLTSIFKSYPSYADSVIYLALLPLWGHTYQYMRNTLVVVVMFLVCTVLSPILWHLWIFAGSANANFYFAITLVYSTAQIFLITDVLYAFLRREFDLVNGVKPTDEKGRPATIMLD